jgi:hypothetical protein
MTFANDHPDTGNSRIDFLPRFDLRIDWGHGRDASAILGQDLVVLEIEHLAEDDGLFGHGDRRYGGA